MDSEGWLSVKGLKYLIKWHHSGSYQLYPGNVFSDYMIFVRSYDYEECA